MKDYFELLKNTLKSGQNKSKIVEILGYALLGDVNERWRTSTTRFQGAADCCSLVIFSFEV